MTRSHFGLAIGFALATAFAALLAACAGGSGAPSPMVRTAELSPPTILSALPADVRTVSGLPVGIRVFWERVSDPSAVGYYLYRSTSTIPDSERGNPALRVNSGGQIPQPPSGSTVEFDDLEFPGGHPEVGTTYFYRLSVVNDTGGESDLSNEIQYTVAQQNVTGFFPLAGFYGETVTIEGEFFGAHDAEVDEVHFSGARGTIPAEIISWNDTEIAAAVPDLCVSGPVFVIIDGTIAASDEDFIVLSPNLTGISATHAKEGDAISLFGENLGASQGANEIAFSMEESIPQVLSWSPTEIQVVVPPIEVTQTASTITVTVDGSQLQQFAIDIEPVIESPGSLNLADGEEAVIEGRHFGTSGNLIVGASEVSTESWSPILIRAIVDSAWTDGALFVVTAHSSNAIPFTRDAALFASAPDGFDNSVLDILTGEFRLEIETNSNAESVDFIVDGVIRDTDSAPTDGFATVFDPADFSNFRHFLVIRVHRRGIQLDSAPIPFFVRSFDGDYNGDDEINDSDAQSLLDFWTGTILQSGDNGAAQFPTYDGNRDGVIDERDAALVGYRYGDTRT
ncbi:MAG: hypothetical protein HRF49_00985 [bacterium]|jgi:hypothetical protein